jgi:hypothetical protein
MAVQHPTPLDPEERERFERDPAAYEAIGRLHVAYEQLVDALNEQREATCLLLEVVHEPVLSAYLEKGWTAAGLEESLRERFTEAPLEAGRAQVRWAAAVSGAEALLRDRQEGGA